MTTDLPALEATAHQSTLVLKIIPEKLHDFEVMRRVREQMLAEVQTHHPTVVILDLSQVKLLGSVAFLALLAIRRQPDVKRVILCELDQLVLEMFTLCRLIPTEGHTNAPFEMTLTLAEALAAA